MSARFYQFIIQDPFWRSTLIRAMVGAMSDNGEDVTLCCAECGTTLATALNGDDLHRVAREDGMDCPKCQCPRAVTAFVQKRKEHL